MTNTNETKKEKRMTKKDYFHKLLEIEAVKADVELTAFVEHELELLANKNRAKDGNKKPTATQLENEKLKQAILDFMEPDNLYTISELQKKVPECEELSNQKIAALLRQLKDDEHKVEKIEDKRKIYWKLV